MKGGKSEDGHDWSPASNPLPEGSTTRHTASPHARIEHTSHPANANLHHLRKIGSTSKPLDCVLGSTGFTQANHLSIPVCCGKPL